MSYFHRHFSLPPHTSIFSSFSSIFDHQLTLLYVKLFAPTTYVYSGDQNRSLRLLSPLSGILAISLCLGFNRIYYGGFLIDVPYNTWMYILLVDRAAQPLIETIDQSPTLTYCTEGSCIIGLWMSCHYVRPHYVLTIFCICNLPFLRSVLGYSLLRRTYYRY